MKRSIIRVICFLLILIMVLGYWNSVFKVKHGDGIYSLTKFYELEDDTVDVLVLGSSHAFESFNTGMLWDEHGMSSYILAGSLQPIWNTYYYLKEALKTQTPKLIVLEGYCLGYSPDADDESIMIKNTFGLRWSKNKIDALKATVPKERWSEFVLEYSQYHTRYKELTREDFLKNQGDPFYNDWKGFGCNMATVPMEGIDVSAVEESVQLPEKTEMYYRMLLSLAQENHIPITVVVAPYAGITVWEQQNLNRAEEIALDMGVQFVNCNRFLDEIGIDYTMDAADPGHLNYRGNQKFTRFIGQYLAEHYDLPDRRGDEAYDSWNRHAEYIRQMLYNQELIECTSPSEIIQKIKNPNYWVCLSIDGTCTSSDEHVKGYLEELGIEETGAGGIWLRQNGTVVWNSDMENGEVYQTTPSHDFHLKRHNHGNGLYTNTMIIDRVPYMKVANGMNVVVYDTVTEGIVDVWGLNMDDDYSIVR